MSRQKTIIIKDIDFHKLWTIAIETNEFNKYFNTITDTKSTKYVNLNKYNLTNTQIYELLDSIYKTSKLNISEIMKQYDLTNAAFSHKFCIPIRTVEDWKSAERTSSPAYIKLMILRLLGHKILPPFVAIESWTKINESKNNTTIITTDVIDQLIKDDETDEMLIQDYSPFFSLKDWEQTHVTTETNTNTDTDYLDKIIHRKDK